MKKKKTLHCIALIVGVVFFAVLVKAAAETPKEAVRTTVDAVLNVLQSEELSSPDKKEERTDRIRTLIRKRFDFEEMSKRSLARHWRERTDEEKREFVDIFSELLISSYVSKIDAYTNEKVGYGREVLKGGGRYGVVSTTIITKDVDIPIDYKLINKNGKWRVYDVIIEGVSFISTYRSQYNKIIVRNSYSKLIEEMKQKLEEVKDM